MNSILVVPSIREVKLEYLEPALQEIDKLLVVDDSDGSIQLFHPKAEVFDYKAQKKYMGGDYRLVPHKSKACAIFGTYYAYKEGFTQVAVLDDDCRVPSDYVSFLRLLGTEQVLETSGLNPWFDPIPLFGYYARGFPFYLRTQPKLSPEIGKPASRHLSAICGLWDLTPDINAIDKLVLSPQAIKLPKMSLRFAEGYFPMSGMNLLMEREVTPAFPWFPKIELLDHFTLNRHEDIWSGFILQTVAKHLGLGIAFGPPIVEHRKENDLQAELVSEFCEQQLCHWFYDAVEFGPLEASNLIDCVSQIGSNLLAFGNNLEILALPLPSSCLKTLGEYILDWMEVFARA